MGCGPLIIVEDMVEDLGVEQVSEVGTLLDHHYQVVLEEV